MPASIHRTPTKDKAPRDREEDAIDDHHDDHLSGPASLVPSVFSHSSHTPPPLFPSILGSSFKRPRTTSPPTSTDETGSETDVESATVATPSAESDSLPPRQSGEKDGNSVVSAPSSHAPHHQAFHSVHGHNQHQHTPLRFSFGTGEGDMSSGEGSNSKAAIDDLLSRNMLNITDGDSPTSGLPSYSQATGQSIEVSTPPVDTDMTSTVMPSIGKPECDVQLAKVIESNKQALSVGQSWFLVDRKWFRLWSTACSDQDKSKEDGNIVVGMVQTRDLLSVQHGITFLKPGLEEGIQFELLSRESWDLVVSWYGRVDPPIERKVIKMPSSDVLRIELYPPVLKIACIGERSTSFAIVLSVLQTLGDLKKAAAGHVGQLSADVGSMSDVDFRFWRLPPVSGDSPLTKESLQVAGVELLQQDKADQTTLAELQLDQPVESLALEVKKSGSAWPFTEEGKPASSVKGIFKQDGGDFLSRMQSGKSPAAAAGSGGVQDMAAGSAASSSSGVSNSNAGRVTRSQTAAERGSEKQRGLTGLYNLGNTCFMNAALQCMSNTKELKDYFVSGVYKSEVNTSNPLGMGGAMAKVFGELLAKLWGSSGGAWHPREFKTVLSRFSPQFIGYAQQDSQELLAFLLDGLHEDLNRIVKKPYIEAPDWEGGGLREMVAFAHKQWEIYKLRNDSVIVDLFQGQYRSTLVCPDCGKVSIKFDPFMYLTLPIPDRKTYTRKVIYLPWDSQQEPVEVEMQFTGETSIAKLKKNLGEWFQADPHNMVACDVFNRSFYRVYGDFESAGEIGANDVTFVYELPGRLKPVAPLPGTASYHRRETLADLEGKDEAQQHGIAGQEMAIVPVFSIAKGSKHFSNYYNRGGGSAFGQPFFVAVAKESVDDVSAIQQAVLDKYMQYTADKDALQRFLDDLGEEEATGSQEDWHMISETASPVVLPHGGNVGDSSQDTVAEIHDGGEVIHVAPSDPQPAEKDAQVQKGSAKKTHAKPFTLHFAVHREDQAPVTLKPDGHEEYGEELNQRASRLAAARAGQTDRGSTRMDTDQDGDLEPHAGRATASGRWPLIYSGGALVCSWSDEVKEKVFGQHDEGWGGGSSRATFVDPQLRAERTSESSGGKKSKTTITIDDCLNEFTKEEQLGESDPWYCPQCKQFKQATKKFDLWKVPDILVVHLKRFSSGRISRDKIDAFVDFPVHGLDLTARVEGARAVSQLHEEEEDDEKLMQSIGSLGADDDAVESDAPIYDLYAVDNHYGGLGGGHYTAYGKNPEDEKWYYFDDSSVRAVADAEEAKGKAAYLLFYRRRTTRPIGGKSREKVREKVKSDEGEETAHPFQQVDMNRAADAEEEGDSTVQNHAVDHARLARDSPLLARENVWDSDEEMPSPSLAAFEGQSYASRDWDAVLDGRGRQRRSSSDGGSGVASIGDLDDSSFEADNSTGNASPDDGLASALPSTRPGNILDGSKSGSSGGGGDSLGASNQAIDPL